MFKKAQNPNYLSIGGVAPLSVATAKEVSFDRNLKESHNIV